MKYRDYSSCFPSTLCENYHVMPTKKKKRCKDRFGLYIYKRGRSTIWISASGLYNTNISCNSHCSHSWSNSKYCSNKVNLDVMREKWKGLAVARNRTQDTRTTTSLSHTPGSHSVCAVRTPVGVNWKILSIRREPMLSGFLSLFTFFYFLITSKFSLFQHEARVLSKYILFCSMEWGYD